MKLKLLIIFLCFILFSGCNAGSPPENSPPQENPAAEQEEPEPAPSRDVQVKIAEAFSGLSFSQPVEFCHAGDNSGRIFVAEKTGKIRVFLNDPQVQSSQVFLDLTSLVDSRSSEKGLLGLAFHPDYENNGFFYVNYTNQSNTVIARYQANPANPGQALPDSAKVILTLAQPYPNHNGGRLDFGADGYLYIAAGDGGSAGDPQNNAQDRSNLLGKILRIDVDKTDVGGAYGIPPDNPWAGNREGFREEIYAYGLRNPWKFSFDGERGWLWAADVGQNRLEEINIIEKGGNYGWNIMEGSAFYQNSGNNKDGLSLPVWEYPHSLGNSITGGYVYYGTEIPGLGGAYIYGDFGSGAIWALWLDDGQADNRILLQSDLNISSFGLDQENELYILDYRGKIYKLTQ